MRKTRRRVLIEIMPIAICVRSLARLPRARWPAASARARRISSVSARSLRSDCEIKICSAPAVSKTKKLFVLKSFDNKKRDRTKLQIEILVCRFSNWRRRLFSVAPPTSSVNAEIAGTRSLTPVDGGDDATSRDHDNYAV